MSPASIKFGFLYDSAEINLEYPNLRAMHLRMEEFNDAGGFEGRQVEFVYKAANGAHEGMPGNCIPAWRELAANPEIIGILGPGISDNTIAIIDTVDEGKVPTINWSGSDLTRGEWYFHFQAGSLPDEGPYLARLMAELGHKRVGVLQSGVVGEYYYREFERECHRLGMEVAARQLAHVHATDVVPEMQRLREASPDSVVFLGMGEPTMAFGRAIRDIGWDIPRFGNIALLSLARNPDAVNLNEGIVWVDQYEPRNPQLISLIERYTKRYGVAPPENFMGPIGHDMMTLMVEGLQRSTNLTPEGFKEGLEQVRQIPCATGGLNPVMGFGPWDRAAIKGPDLLMYRTVRDGELVTFEP